MKLSSLTLGVAGGNVLIFDLDPVTGNIDVNPPRGTPLAVKGGLLFSAENIKNNGAIWAAKRCCETFGFELLGGGRTALEASQIQEVFSILMAAQRLGDDWHECVTTNHGKEAKVLTRRERSAAHHSTKRSA